MKKNKYIESVVEEREARKIYGDEWNKFSKEEKQLAFELIEIINE